MESWFPGRHKPTLWVIWRPGNENIVDQMKTQVKQNLKNANHDINCLSLESPTAPVSWMIISYEDSVLTKVNILVFFQSCSTHTIILLLWDLFMYIEGRWGQRQALKFIVQPCNFCFASVFKCQTSISLLLWSRCSLCPFFGRKMKKKSHSIKNSISALLLPPPLTIKFCI